MARKLASAPHLQTSNYQSLQMKDHLAHLPPPTRTEVPMLESHEYKPSSWNSNVCEVDGRWKVLNEKEHLEDCCLSAHRKLEYNIYSCF